MAKKSSWEAAKATIVELAARIDHQEIAKRTIGNQKGIPVLHRGFALTPSRPVWVLRVMDHPAYPNHKHTFTEIAIVLKGVGVNVIDGKPFNVSSGDVFVIQGAHEHAIKNPQGLAVLNICFDPEDNQLRPEDFADSPGFKALFGIEPRLRRKMPFRQMLRLSSKQLARVEVIAQNIETETQLAQPGYHSIVRAELIELIALLSRWYGSSFQKDVSQTRRLASALLWMEQNVLDEENIGSRLAKMTNLSQRQFFRVFHAATGQTPVQYLISLRLRRASELLLDPTINITEAAFAAGFNNSNYFARMFKRFSGFSPSEFRLKNSGRGTTSKRTP